MSDTSIPDEAYIDRVIDIVARVHGFVLDKDDPVLATATLHKVIVGHLINDIKEAGNENLKKYIEAMEEKRVFAKEEATEIIKSAIKENSETLQAEAQKAADIINDALKAQDELLKANKNSRNISILSSAIALFSMITVLIVIAK